MGGCSACALHISRVQSSDKEIGEDTDIRPIEKTQQIYNRAEWKESPVLPTDKRLLQLDIAGRVISDIIVVACVRLLKCSLLTVISPQ